MIMLETNDNAFGVREDGYIKLYRSIKDSWVFAHPEKLKVWIWCLTKASFKSRYINLNVGNGQSTIGLKTGEFVFGRKTAADELCMPGSSIYKVMKKFESEGMIKIRSSSKYSIITICKWDAYQHDTPLGLAAKEQQDSSEGTTKEQHESIKGTARELQESTNNKDKNDNNGNKKKEGIADKKLSAEDQPDFIDKVVNEFKEAYEEANNVAYEPIANGKERKMAGIIAGLYKKKNPGIDTEKTLADLRQYFESCVRINDDYLAESMSLSTIVNQFNKINNILKNGKQKNRRGATDEQLAAIISKHFATDHKEQ